MASGNSNGVGAVGGVSVGRVWRWGGNLGEMFEEPGVVFSYLASFGVPFIEVFEFSGENGGLETIKTAVDADSLVEIFFGTAVVFEQADLAGGFIIIGSDEAAITIGAEIFGGVKTKTAGVAESAEVFLFIFGSYTLGGVFDNGEMMVFGDF